ncbi:MAG TPA: DUF5615 family PIN-like protein [Catalimonadaceae bacterium]|nr:DUF5615 family PIN-like protein [Catalimonadaceae bacterium]HPI09690.1 DUF5615 family PIN-like protein [Catalimonadaceae bacterium]
MKFLADEGIDKKLVIELRSLGFDVEYVAESKFGTQDKVLLQYAWENNRVVLTKDKDFGELVFKSRIPTKGVILLRMEDKNSTERIQLSLNWFKKLDWDFEMKYTTLTSKQARVIELV